MAILARFPYCTEAVLLNKSYTWLCRYMVDSLTLIGKERIVIDTHARSQTKSHKPAICQHEASSPVQHTLQVRINIISCHTVISRTFRKAASHFQMRERIITLTLGATRIQETERSEALSASDEWSRCSCRFVGLHSCLWQWYFPEENHY